MQTFYLARLRELTPEQRIDLGIKLWEAGDAMQRANIQRKYPGISEDEFRYRLCVVRYGQELAENAFGPRECP